MRNHMTIKKPNANIDLTKNPGLVMSPKVPKIPTMPKQQDTVQTGMAPESKKDPVKQAEQLKNKDSKKEAMKEAVSLNKHGQWSLNEPLEKKKPAFNPRKEQESDAAGLRDKWINFDDDSARQKMPRMEGSARTRSMSKLAGSTDYRRNSETNEVEFLMHRGMSQGEHDNHHNHETGHTDYGKDAINGWTPNKSVAHDFGMYGGDGEAGHVASAWVPESQLHSSMRQYGGKDSITQKMTRDEDEWLISHNNPIQHHEVVPANKNMIDRKTPAAQPKVKGKSDFSPEAIKAMEDAANKKSV